VAGNEIKVVFPQGVSPKGYERLLIQAMAGPEKGENLSAAARLCMDYTR
jgi:hypothetical protein